MAGGKPRVIWHRDGLLLTKTHGPGHPSGATREPFIQPQVSFLWQSGAHGTISQPVCMEWQRTDVLWSPFDKEAGGKEGHLGPAGAESACVI